MSTYVGCLKSINQSSHSLFIYLGNRQHRSVFGGMHENRTQQDRSEGSRWFGTHNKAIARHRP